MKILHRLASIFLAIAIIIISVPIDQLVQAQEPGYLVYLPVVSRPEPSLWMGPGGGSIVCLAVDQRDETIVYAGTINGGVFKSSDRGLTWTAVNKGLPNLFIDSLAVDPLSGAVYAGTHGNGVYKTTDGGESWFVVNKGIAANAVVYTLAVNPSNPQIVFAGTRIDGTFYTGILYRSLNGGASWENVLEYSDGWVYSLAVNPSRSNEVLAAVHEKGAWLSSDNGASGSWVKTGTPALDDFSRSRWLKGRAAAFDPSGNKAYYGAWHDGMVSYTSNNGQNWSMASGVGKARVYPNGIAVHPLNGNVVYLADHNHGTNADGILIPGSILKSVDGGASYTTLLSNKLFYTVAVLPGAGASVLAGTYTDGLWRSDNGGSTWARSVQGLNNSRVTGMVFSSVNEVYASTTSGGGVYKSSDGGVTWVEFNNGLDDDKVNRLIIHPTNPRILFALTTSAGLKRINLDGGSLWSTLAVIDLPGAAPLAEIPSLYGVETALPDGELFSAGDEASFLGGEISALPSAPLLAMAFAPSNPNVVYLGSNGSGVYASENGGLDWRYAGLTGKAVRDVAVSPTDAGRLYAATSEKGAVQVSTNGAASWSVLPLPNAGLEGYAVTTTPSDPGSVFVGTSNGVYRYDGSSWSHTGLGGEAVTQLAAHPANPGLLIAGTPLGVYGCWLSYCNWFTLDEQLSGTGIASINFRAADPRYVYLGSNARGTLRVRVGY